MLHRSLRSPPAACAHTLASFRAVQSRHTQARVLCARPAVKAATAPKADQSLLKHVVHLTKQFVADTDNKDITDDEALLLMEEQSLLARPGLYAHLHKNLRELRVRTKVGPEGSEEKRDLSCGIAFVDPRPRCPRNILHPKDRAELCKGSISVDAYIREGPGHQLKHPKLFCVAVLHKPWQDDPDKQQRYKTWPLECCWCYADKRTKAAGEQEEWRVTDIQLGIAAPIPPWVAECFSSGHAGQPSSHDSSIISSSGADSREQLEPEKLDTSEAHAVACDTAPDPVNQLVKGLTGFSMQLYPTAEESERLRAVTDAVCHVLMRISRTESWQVAQVLPVGSFAKKTSLTNAHDLDLLVDLQTQQFEKDRMQCLDRIRSALCSKPVPGGVVEAASLGRASGSTETNPVFATGWTVHHECTYLHLCHPTLNINLDIQVCPFVQHSGESPEDVRLQFLKHFVNHHRQTEHSWHTRHKEQQGTPGTLSPCLDSSADAASSYGSLERHWQVDTSLYKVKERSIFLSVLLTALVQGIDVKCRNHYSMGAAGDLATTVIRLLKAWTKYGLEELQPPTSKFPGFVWEVLVLYVLEQQCKALDSAAAVRRYGTSPHRKLNLFMDVLQCAAECLGPAGRHGRSPILLADFCTTDDLELFRDTGAWGPPHSDTPWIIHPADPSNNCARNSTFGSWGVVAQAAGQLHQQLQQLRQGSFSHQQGAAGSDDAWQVVLEDTTLGRAVKEVAAQRMAVH